MSVARRLALLASVIGAMTAFVLGAPATASADRCQPEEFVFGQGNTLVNETDNPACIVALQVVYPALACDSTSLMKCIASLDPAGTIVMAPYTASQTPARASAAVAASGPATHRAIRDGCTFDIRWTDDFVVCRVAALQARLPIALSR
jgi:hypothetical protein